ncbi:MAG: hypothetical protein FVQ80_07580 [Planctomycetes bacterium]|nr:hypothetical protein [Planctomycetota bacterium]
MEKKICFCCIVAALLFVTAACYVPYNAVIAADDQLLKTPAGHHCIFQKVTVPEGYQGIQVDIFRTLLQIGAVVVLSCAMICPCCKCRKDKE